MFDRKKAIKYYKQMLADLEATKRAAQNIGQYDGIDRGFVTVPQKKATKKVTGYLKVMADRDGYNFSDFDVRHYFTGELKKLYSIDNEPEEMKKQKMAEIMASVERISPSKIVYLQDYIQGQGR